MLMLLVHWYMHSMLPHGDNDEDNDEDDGDGDDDNDHDTWMDE